jgi:hypothetical protein
MSIANFLWPMRLTKVSSARSLRALGSSLMSRACSCRPSVSAAARSDRPAVSRGRPLHVFRSAVRVRGIGFRVVAYLLRFSSLPHLLRKLKKNDRGPSLLVAPASTT